VVCPGTHVQTHAHVQQPPARALSKHNSAHHIPQPTLLQMRGKIVLAAFKRCSGGNWSISAKTPSIVEAKAATLLPSPSASDALPSLSLALIKASGRCNAQQVQETRLYRCAQTLGHMCVQCKDLTACILSMGTATCTGGRVLRYRTRMYVFVHIHIYVGPLTAQHGVLSKD
jgi:hypothetical protein